MSRAATILLAAFGVLAGNAEAANLPADATAILGGNPALTAPFAAPISDSFSSETGRLTVRIDRARAGRKVRRGHGTVCKVTHRRVKHGRCTAYTKAATVTGAVKAGNVTVKLTGRVGRRRMAAAPYRLTVTLRDAWGNVSKPALLRFTIIPG